MTAISSLLLANSVISRLSNSNADRVLYSVEINVVIIASCIPTLPPLYRVMFHRPGAENLRVSPCKTPPYQRHLPRHNKICNGRGPDTELLSLDTKWAANGSRGIDHDEEELANQEHGTMKKTVVMDVRSHGPNGSESEVGELRHESERTASTVV